MSWHKNIKQSRRDELKYKGKKVKSPNIAEQISELKNHFENLEKILAKKVSEK